MLDDAPKSAFVLLHEPMFARDRYSATVTCSLLQPRPGRQRAIIVSIVSAPSISLSSPGVPHRSRLPPSGSMNTAGAHSKSAEPCRKWHVHSSTQAHARCEYPLGRVGSDAAAKLRTRAFAELNAHPKKVGRAEAFRVSMRELIERGSPAEVHPSMWARLVVVGEGAT
jgi:hypothetical protein